MASPCVIKYNNKEYSYEEFAAMMHDGLLRDLLNKDIIDNSDFEGSMEVFEAPEGEAKDVFQKTKENLAPNGKPSNLSPEQYKLVRTPAFKKWFGDWENDPKNASKVLDENGEPLPVYHGSGNKFNEFNKELLGSFTGAESAKKGFFFSDNENVSESYRKATMVNNPNLIGLEERLSKMSLDEINRFLDNVLKMNEYYVEDYDSEEQAKEYAISDIGATIANDSEGYYEDRNRYIEKAADYFNNKNIFNKNYTKFKPYEDVGMNIETALVMKNPKIFDAEENDVHGIGLSDIISKAIEDGYDGVIVKNVYDSISFDERGNDTEISNIYIIFEPNQTKLISGQNTTFDVNSNRIDLQKESTISGDVDKVVSTIQKAMPKVKVVYDKDLKAAGKWSPSNNTITVNPNYAGLDTPIHEAGHVLIDAIGYNNKVIQAAIKQLKDTKLWKETKGRYKELSEEELGKEVLAEAIGVEGAGIFDTQVEKNKFQNYLDYIFDWLKTKLGINKNIAKSLAKQIIGGVRTKEVKSVSASKESLQKAKARKPGKPQVLGFRLYRETVLLKNVAQEEKDLKKIDDLLDSGTLSLAEEKQLEEIKNKIEYQKRKELKTYRSYKAGLTRINEIIETEDLSSYDVDQLMDVLSDIEQLDNRAKEAFGNDVKLRIALFLDRQGKDRLLKEHSSYIEEVANKKDISATAVNMMVMSQADQNQPAIQELSKVFDEAYLDKTLETNRLQSENEQLASAVIKEKNKQLGLLERGKNFLFANDTARYFEYMINPKAVDLGNGTFKPGYYTIAEGKKKGFSKAQLNYLKFHRDLVEERSKQIIGKEFDEASDLDMEIIQVDKGFREAFRTEGVVNAFSYYLGGGKNSLGRVRIEYTDPVTKKTSIEYFATIEKKIANYGKKGLIEKGKALGYILRYNFKARRQLKSGMNADEKTNPLEVKGTGEYSIGSRGQLVSKFDKNRENTRGYSADMFRAANEFISENAHTNNMTKVLTLARSVQLLANKGYAQEGIKQKPNVEKYLDEWVNMHLFNQQREGEPVLDSALRKLRGLVSLSTMAFNLTAQGLNAAFGIYNNWRSENKETLGKGYKRLFGGKRDFSKAGGYGAFNTYAMDIIRKYNIVSIDTDSNPNMGLGDFFQKLANWGTKWGEVQTQASLALGLMSEEDFKSFEYVTKPNGTKTLEVKPGVDEKALKQRIIAHTNRVSDIQGKYSEKDRVNLMNSEFYKAVFQFKVWMPSWFKERFGAEYINRDGKVVKSSWSVLQPKAFKELKRQIKKDGWKKGLYDGNTPEAKAAMSNLKGLMVMGMVLVLKYSDDEDDRKRKEAMLADKLMGNLLFVFDPSTLKYTLQNPVPAVGVAIKYIDAVEKLSKFEEKETMRAVEEVGGTLPFKKVKDIYDDVTEE